MQSGEVRLGIIGAGLAARWLHWPALERMRERFSVSLVADISQEAASSFAAMAGGCPWTLDYRELLASERVEAVLVLLPIHLNAQVLLESVLAGKHTLCEKPVASNLEQARWVVAQVESLAATRGLVAGIAEHFHYRGDIKQARHWIEGGRIGDLFMVDIASYYYTDTGEGFGSTPWRHDSQYRGGAITDAAVHQAALLRELGGEVEQLQAFTKLVHPELSGFDTLALNLRYRNGALGRLFFSAGAAEARTPFLQASIFGTRGSITMDDFTATLRATGGETETFGPYDNSNAYYDQLANFHDAITGRAEIVSTPAEAMRDLEILMRAYDSAESRSVVLL